MAFYQVSCINVLPEKLKPVRDWMLVFPEPLPERRASGLYYPENRLKYPRTGKIMRCGPDVSFDLGPGDRVAFLRAGAEPFRLDDGAEYILLRERNVLFRIDEMGQGDDREVRSIESEVSSPRIGEGLRCDDWHL